MPSPAAYSGLKGWYDVSSQHVAYSDGDAVATLYDNSGGARDLAQATGNKQPLWFSNQIGGNAALRFDGSNDELLSADLLSAFLKATSFTMFAVARTISLTTAGGSGTNRPFLWCGEAGAVGLGLNGSLKEWRAFHDDGSAPTDVESVAGLVIGQAHIVMMRHESGNIYLSVDGGSEVSFASGTASPANSTAGNYLCVGRNYTGAGTKRWWNGDLAELIVYEDARTAGEIAEIYAYLQNKYGLGSIQSLTEQARTCLSAKLLRERVAQDALEDHPIPLWVALDNDPIDRAGFAHADWPHPTGLGAGSQDWRRRLMEFQRIAVSLDSMSARATLHDLRRYVRTEWGLFAAGELGQGNVGDGMARLSQGPPRYFARSSECWVDSPAADGVVTRVDVGVPALDRYGLLLQRGRTNYQLRSSFLSGTTGLAAKTGSGTRSLDTTVLLFGVEETGAPANSLKLAADPTISTEFDQALPVTAAFGVSDQVVVSVDVYDAAAAQPGFVAIQRGTGTWWRKSDSSWQASKTWNTLPATPGAWSRWESGAMTPGATTLQVHLGVPTSGVGSQINYYGHIQVEVGAWASSRIISDDVAVSRLADTHSVPNDADPGRTFPFAPGSCWWQFVLQWPSTDTSEHYGFEAYLDASNWARLRWDGAGNWKFELRAAGTTYTATKAGSHAAGDTVSVGARLCSASGEEDLTAYTISVFVAGVKGTDAVAAAYGGVPEEADLYIGMDRTSALQIDGSLKALTILPYAASDVEMARANGPG